MASSRERWLLSGVCAVALSIGCSQGQGEGALTGTLTVGDCGLAGAAFDLQPDYFTAEIVDELLDIRIQSSSDLDIYTDGLHLLVHDVSAVRRSMLGTPLAIGGPDAPVTATLYLNETCPAGRRAVPRLLESTGGSIVFEALYAPSVDGGSERAIRAQIPQITLQDPGMPDERFGAVSGWFSFFYQRGRPSQRYP